MKKIIFMLLALTALYGCSKMEQIPDKNDGDLLIRLEGVINTVNMDSRAPIIGDKPTSDMELVVLRANANAVGDNPAYSGYISSANATLKTDGKITWETAIGYPGDGRYTKLIGLYPRGTVNLTAKTVTYTGFNGTQDIMCSGFLQGRKSNPITDKMVLNHILTQVQVFVKGQDANTIGEWGKVTGITISGKAGTVTVGVPDPQSGSTPTLSLASASDLTVPNSTSGGVSFDTNETQYGVAMFVPVTNGTLEFKVTTQFGGTKTLTTTTARAYAKATAYKITIVFKNGGDISIGGGTGGDGSGSMVPWVDAGSSTSETIEAN
jgi:hypothetical protein